MARIRGVGLYAPAGFVTEPKAIDRAIARLEATGRRVIVDPTVRRRWQRFAAPDDERLAAVTRMADDAGVDLAIAVRGGYGWSRLLDRIDFAALAAVGKCWLGHSDFTAFQLAAWTHARMVSFSGPMAAYDFGAASPSSFTLEHCWGLLDASSYEIELPLDGPDFDATGTLWGGNLAMVAHLVGTRHFPHIDGGLLALEDVGEHPYRIERMLYQLHFAGILARQRAVLLGSFNGFEPSPNDNGYDLATAIGQARERFGVPIFCGLPFGHCRDKLTLPFGGRCELAVAGGRARMRLSDYGQVP
ncbi:MAG TPA: LD-carboxypeptidase [Casimicrobiaceae bacterium]|nr:LD-carboxypeptidase [Casimicrobiaceae bacterium]